MRFEGSGTKSKPTKKALDEVSDRDGARPFRSRSRKGVRPSRSTAMGRVTASCRAALTVSTTPSASAWVSATQAVRAPGG